jgi:hypothetical protein
MAIGTAGIVAISTSIASAGASAAQASTAGQAAKAAKKDSEAAFKRAMNELTSNKFAGLNLPTEAYEREREAMLSAGAQAIGQAAEGEGRGVAAAAGRVQMAQQEGQRQIAGAMGEDLMKLEGLTAQEEARLSGARANLELAQAEGAQAAAAQFGAQKDAAITGAFSSLANAGQQYLQSAELYQKSEGQRELDRLNKEYDKAVKGGDVSKTFKDASGNTLSFDDATAKLARYDKAFSPLVNMTPLQRQDFLSKNPDLLRALDANIFSQELGMGPVVDLAPKIGLPQTQSPLVKPIITTR